MSNLASVLIKLAQYGEAAKLLWRTLEIYGKSWEADHPNILTTRSELVKAFTLQGKYDGAERMHRELLELDRKAGGIEHPDTLSSQNDLAPILGYQGKLGESPELY